MSFSFILDSHLLASNSNAMREQLAQLIHYFTFYYRCSWSVWHDGSFGLYPWHEIVPSPIPYPELQMTSALPSNCVIITTSDREQIVQGGERTIFSIAPTPDEVVAVQQMLTRVLSAKLLPFKKQLAPSQRFYELTFPSGWEELFHNRTKLPPSENIDCDNYGPFGWLRRLEYSWSLAQVDYRAGSSIIDIGSLETFIPRYLAERGLDVTSIDIDEVGVKFQQGVASKLPKPFRVELQDITKTSYSDESFDQALMISTVEHIPNDGDCRAMREIHRILRPNGIVAVTTPYDHHWAHEDTGIRPHNYLQRYYSMQSAMERLAPQNLFEVVDIEFIGGELHSPGNYTPQFINPTNADIIALALRKR
ncbi:MAG: class I SAM-dependent methyltransferase [Bacteroidetes bacterium]|nr:class I SAM-dependent methyltransferase [Bacteroidota bacterium]